MKNNKKDTFVSKTGNHKEERLELLNKKIKEKFETKEEFFKNLKFKEETFKRKLFEGSHSMSELYKTQELLNLKTEETIFLFFGETPEEQNKLLITEEMMKGQSEEVKNFLRATNTILKGKSIEAREIFLKDLQKTIEEDLKGSDSK